MNIKLSEAVNVNILKDMVKFNGITEIGFASISKLEDGPYKVNVADVKEGRYRHTSFTIDEYGVMLSAESEFTETLEKDPQESKPREILSATPFTIQELITAVNKAKSENAS